MRYRVHRIRDAQREAFRWAAHTSGVAIAKLKDYQPAEELEAATPYAVWKVLSETGAALRPGDLLESLDPPHSLQIAKYIGFEPAQWFVPEVKSEHGTELPQMASNVGAAQENVDELRSPDGA